MSLQRLRSINPAHLLLLVASILAMLDIVLLERKYNLFSGGFLLAERIDGFSERLTFATVVFAIEFGLAGCAWYVLHIVGLIRGASALQTRFLFLFLYGGSSVAVIVLKYRVLAYFGDFLSLGVIRNLGGGSLSGALMYGAVEIALAGAWIIPVATLGWYLNRAIKVREKNLPRFAIKGSVKQLVLRMSACAAALFAVSVAASADHSMSKYLPKTTPYALVQAVLKSVTEPKVSFLNHFAESMPQPVTRGETTIRFGERKDHLVLIVSESTRADVLAAQWEGSPVTPNWLGVAREGTAAQHYYSHTGFTSSSLKAIFLASLGSGRPLGGSLFEILKKNGYQIAVISGQDESFGNIAGASGSEKLADFFFDARSAKSERVFASSDSGSLALSNGRVVKEFDVVAGKLDWSRPVFVYVNLQAAHFPYHHDDMPRTVEQKPLQRSEINTKSGERLRSTYLNAVAYSDWATGQIVDRLRQLGVYNKTLVTVSGDHGESLFDDGVLGHGIRLSDTQMKTLLVSNRALPGFKNLLGQTDLAATLLQGVGAELSGYLPARHGVVQVIGSLQSPAQLGYVYPDGQRLSIDNENREIHTSWLRKPLPLAELRSGSREYDELVLLVSEWKKMVAAAPTGLDH